MKVVLIAGIALILNSRLHAGDSKPYNISHIPANLLKNANVVKRTEDIRFEIMSLNKSSFFRKIALTILNEQGDRYATIYEHYNKMHSVKSIEGTLFDETGDKIKALKKSEIRDESAISDFSLYEDSRIKYHSFNYKIYPYTIEYIIETEFDGSLFIPDWRPRPYQLYSVQNSSIQITVPQSIGLRYKVFNLAEPLKQTIQKDNLVYTASLNNLEAIIDEPFQPYSNEISPTVFFAANEFKYDNWKGNLSSWQSFGKFQNELNAGRDVLPENIKAEVQEIIKNKNDIRQKIEALYKYMQKNTRYISIQLGIGGLQPFDASFVAQKKYGDCKALSNYMYALLKEAGIRSCYTMVGAGRDADDKFTLPDFPNDYFNHIILAVPLKNDTLWLECTSQTLPAGYLSDFTQNRYVLLVDERGGNLVKTPKYGFEQNWTRRNVEADLDQEGNLFIKSNTTYSAMQQDELQQQINNNPPEKIKEHLKKSIELPSYDVIKFNYKQHNSAFPLIDEQLDLKAMNYASVSGKRIFIEPNLLNKSKSRILADTARKFGLVLDEEYSHFDSVSINLPAGYTLEAIPKDVTLKSKFGFYKSRTVLQGNKLVYYRAFEKYSGQFSASEYASFTVFTNSVYKADRAKVVLVKKDQ